MDRLSKENLDDSCVEGVRGVRELFSTRDELYFVERVESEAQTLRVEIRRRDRVPHALRSSTAVEKLRTQLVEALEPHAHRATAEDLRAALLRALAQ
jgi:hypothetical protein